MAKKTITDQYHHVHLSPNTLDKPMEIVPRAKAVSLVTSNILYHLFITIFKAKIIFIFNCSLPSGSFEFLLNPK